MDACLGQRLHILLGRQIGLLRHGGDLGVDLFIRDDQGRIFGDLLGLEMLLDQHVEGFALDLGHVLGRRLDLAHDDQQQHPLAQVIAGDDAVIDGGDNAVGDLELRFLRARLGRAVGRGVEGTGGNRRLGLGKGRSGHGQKCRCRDHCTHETHGSF